MRPSRRGSRRALRCKKVQTKRKKALQTLAQSTSQNRKSHLWIGQYIAVFLPEHHHFSGLAITRPYRPDRGRMLYLWSRGTDGVEHAFVVLVSQDVQVGPY